MNPTYEELNQHYAKALAVINETAKEHDAIDLNWHKCQSELIAVKEQLAQAQACCCRKHECLHLINEYWRKQFKPGYVTEDLDEALKTNCGQDLLDERDRYKKALEEILAHNWAHEKNDIARTALEGKQ